MSQVIKEKLVRVQSVEVLEKFRVRPGFTDGTQKEIDLEPYLGGPIFEPIRKDPVVFWSVKVDWCIGRIVWNNGTDIDPDVLYLGLKPAWKKN